MARLRETPKGEEFSHGVKPAAFLCCDYVVDQKTARLRPVEGIASCARCVTAERCAISKHSWRSRKTGPSFPLRILRCRTHAHYFTVYPTGYTPHGRQRLSPIASTAVAPNAAPGGQWEGTVFEAAVGAAAGKLGLREVIHGDPVEPRYATQRRRIGRAGLLLALAAETGERVAEVVAQSLKLLGLEHQSARQAFTRARTLAARGAVIVSVLQVTPLTGTLDTRLLAAGFLVGLWGRPALWDARTSSRTFPSFAALSAPPRGPP